MIQGYVNTKPEIVKLKFSKTNKLTLFLKDGREICFPIHIFPEVESLTLNQRKHWQLIGGEGFTFDDCSEVYHIEQILGTYDSYKHI